MERSGSRFSHLQGWLSLLLETIHTPHWLHSLLIDGIYNVLTCVIAVMLPPMAIFFPLFTLLEDFGYLPRVAFHLDKPFQRACACGKQGLTMCMGFGCNAAGVTGCRIIDSPRERLIAILTNNFIPCNGRFPTMITCISLFFAAGSGLCRSVSSALLLLGLILLGVFVTFAVSRLLSHTILRGVPSSFTLELPPYRKPQFGKVLVRSLLDRTIFVLGRACLAAAPAGAVIWCFTNCHIGGGSIFAHCAALLDTPAQFIGLDGVILRRLSDTGRKVCGRVQKQQGDDQCQGSRCRNGDHRMSALSVQPPEEFRRFGSAGRILYRAAGGSTRSEIRRNENGRFERTRSDNQRRESAEVYALRKVQRYLSVL